MTGYLITGATLVDADHQRRGTLRTDGERIADGTVFAPMGPLGRSLRVDARQVALLAQDSRRSSTAPTGRSAGAPNRKPRGPNSGSARCYWPTTSSSSTAARLRARNLVRRRSRLTA